MSEQLPNTKTAYEQHLASSQSRLSRARTQLEIAKEITEKRATAANRNDKPEEELAKAEEVCKWEREVEICEAEVEDMKELIRRFEEVEVCGEEGCEGNC
jgi:hypothetical protein